jgi:hypothetical protein
MYREYRLAATSDEYGPNPNDCAGSEVAYPEHFIGPTFGKSRRRTYGRGTEASSSGLAKEHMRLRLSSLGIYRHIGCQ